MALNDIRNSLPGEVSGMLLPGEKVYYYGTASGCLSGGKSYVLVTDTRVVGSAIEPGGCLGGGKAASVDIPLEHVSSTRTGTTGGCLGIGGTQTVQVSSGTATSAFSTTNAQEAASVIQQVLRDTKKR